jgi:hypothetical protein
MPVTGARRPCNSVDIDMAPAVSARDQRNSSSSATKKIGKAKATP